MRVTATKAVLAITTAALATTMGDGVIRITAIIHHGRLRPMDTTRIHTMEAIPTLTRTISQGTVTTLQRLLRYSAAWVSSATTTASWME